MEPNDIPRDMIDVELHALATLAHAAKRLEKEKAALLEALEELEASLPDRGTEASVKARAAIRAARGEK